MPQQSVLTCFQNRSLGKESCNKGNLESSGKQGIWEDAAHLERLLDDYWTSR